MNERFVRGYRVELDGFYELDLGTVLAGKLEFFREPTTGERASRVKETTTNSIGI